MFLLLINLFFALFLHFSCCQQDALLVNFYTFKSTLSRNLFTASYSICLQGVHWKATSRTDWLWAGENFMNLQFVSIKCNRNPILQMTGFMFDFIVCVILAYILYILFECPASTLIRLCTNSMKVNNKLNRIQRNIKLKESLPLNPDNY